VDRGLGTGRYPICPDVLKTLEKVADKFSRKLQSSICSLTEVILYRSMFIKQQKRKNAAV
jgi:hypothetical protein